jgi:phage shock protein C
MPTKQKKLLRLPDKGMIAGVAAGFAEYFDVDVTLMRLIFVVITLITGGGAILAYIILAIVMPTPEKAKDNDIDVGKRIENLVEEVSENGRAQRIGNFFGVGLVVFGLWLLIGQIFPDWFKLQWNLLWPSLIIILGIWILSRSKKS